jgi:hypothetical protein
MAQVAFGLTDQLLAGTLTPSTLAFEPGTPWQNVQKDSPGVQAAILEGEVNQGWFEVGSSNKWIDVNEGSGPVSVEVASGYYSSAGALRDAVSTALNTAGGLSDTYTITWVNGWYAIGSTGTFSILWESGTHGSSLADDNIGQELGFSTAADDASAGSHTADEQRYSTAAGFHFDLGSSIALHAFLWYAEGGDDGVAASFDNVAVYLDTAFRGWHRDAWIDASSTAVGFSARPTDQDVNQIQLGFQDPDTATPYRYGFVSWRHWDSSADHRIGLLKAFKATLDSTNGRTIGPLRGHRPILGGEPRNLRNYYAPPGITRWRASMTFPDWEIASWKGVILSLAAHGLQTGALWVEDFTSLKGNTIATTLADVNLGRVLWCTLQSLSGGDATGQADAYRTADAAIEQLR